MEKMRLTLLPVALRPDRDASISSMAVSVLRSDAGSISAVVEDVERVIPQVRQMLAEIVPPEIEGDPDLRSRNRRLESVGVDYSSGVPNLLFSAVLPIAASELDDGANRWAPLIRGAARDGVGVANPELSALLGYWRAQLVRTTAAFDFLPEFFPASQVRAVYSSVWGEEQQEANFQRWLVSARDAAGAQVVAEESAEVVQQSTQAALVKRLSRMLGAEPSRIASNWDPKYVGVSAGVAALGGGMKAIPAAVVAGAVVGSLVSWQRVRGAGRPPTWFRRRSEQRVELQTWYPVRTTFPSPGDLGSFN